jgi:glycosyltransferase involved in cell wall biosynthesis
MKRVLIATPCLDQKVDAYFVHSLCESIKLGLKHDLDIKCVFLANESILPMARNELFNLAYHDNYDIMVFIDDDEQWEPDALIEVLLSEKDVVAIPVVNKGDKKIEFNILYDKVNLDTDGFFEIKSSGTGFLKLSRKVVVDLYESNTELVFRTKKLRNICEYTYLNGSFVGEDITLCRKIKELGYKIWVNPKFTVNHIGNKMYKGNFIEKINEQSNSIL